MNLHATARTCPKSRRLLVGRIEAGWSVMEAAEAAGITDRTARRWLKRWREEGPGGLVDRSSAAHRIPHKTPARASGGSRSVAAAEVDRGADRRRSLNGSLDRFSRPEAC